MDRIANRPTEFGTIIAPSLHSSTAPTTKLPKTTRSRPTSIITQLESSIDAFSSLETASLLAFSSSAQQAHSSSTRPTQSTRRNPPGHRQSLLERERVATENARLEARLDNLGKRRPVEYPKVS